jgi:hypothetical protein
MTHITEPPRVSLWTLLTEGRLTNLPARFMFFWGGMCLFAALGAVYVGVWRQDIPNGLSVVVVLSGFAACAAAAAIYLYRAGQWRHYVQTTLDPENKSRL